MWESNGEYDVNQNLLSVAAVGYDAINPNNQKIINAFVDCGFYWALDHPELPSTQNCYLKGATSLVDTANVICCKKECEECNR